MVETLKEPLVERTFTTKDVFYNNGMVNLHAALEDTGGYEGLEYILETNSLTLKYPKGKEDELYKSLLNDFIDCNDLVFQTDNDRWYWDNQIKAFVLGKKYDVKGKASGNDVLHGVYSYISAEEIGMEPEELYEKFKEFCQKNKLKEKDAETTFFDNKTKRLKSKDKLKLVLYISKQQGIKNFSDYFVSGEELTFDSKIHQFEDGGFCFRDMLVNKDNRIDRWDALIYWYGSRIKRFYNASFFIYMNGQNLKSLYEFKKYLKISDEPKTYRDEKTGKLVKLPTNIDMQESLSLDNITNRYFYISKSEQEFQLKFFMYLFSWIYHIEKDYEEGIDDERLRLDMEALYNGLREITFVTYTEDGNLKSSLNEYTKAYKLMKLFMQLIKPIDDQIFLFKFLAEIIDTINFSKNSKEVNLNLVDFCDNVLNFRPLRKNYYEAAYDILKNDKRSFGKDLGVFENTYLRFIQRGEKEMQLHEKSKKLGEEIGYFIANTDDKDLIFKLRNVKNHRQLVSYFKDVKFSALKNKEESRFTAEFNQVLEQILDMLEKDEKDWEIVRDYIAIYAIGKYKSVLFAKSKQK